MTLKKINKTNKQGQAVFEYFILTAVVVVAVLFFTASPLFQGVKTSCNNAFSQAVEVMLR